MKLTVIVEGQGLDLEPLADILETVAVEKERLMSAVFISMLFLSTGAI